jgi:hypothetical protein
MASGFVSPGPTVTPDASTISAAVAEQTKIEAASRIAANEYRTMKPH